MSNGFGLNSRNGAYDASYPVDQNAPPQNKRSPNSAVNKDRDGGLVGAGKVAHPSAAAAARLTSQLSDLLNSGLYSEGESDPLLEELGRSISRVTAPSAPSEAVE